VAFFQPANAADFRLFVALGGLSPVSLPEALLPALNPNDRRQYVFPRDRQGLVSSFLEIVSRLLSRWRKSLLDASTLPEATGFFTPSLTFEQSASEPSSSFFWRSYPLLVYSFHFPQSYGPFLRGVFNTVFFWLKQVFAPRPPTSIRLSSIQLASVFASFWGVSRYAPLMAVCGRARCRSD